MRSVALSVAACMGLFAASTRAEARVAIRVDLTAQTMSVASASGDYVWPISSARFGYRTPRGTFGIERMESMHYSRKYHNSPMPHSLFFSGGYAIHGTYETSTLGEPASHGCVRIAPGNAAALYQMVRAEGGRITITGNPPQSAVRYARADDRSYPRAVRRRYYVPENPGMPDFGYSEPQVYAPAYGQGFFLGMGNYTD